MKVLDLACQGGHLFEGWFASEDDFQTQLARSLVECPVCGDAAITKRLSAPRLNLGAAAPAQTAKEPPAAQQQQPPPSQPVAMPMPHDAAMQAAWLQMMRRVSADTEDVGRRFAEEARRIHYGESEQRGIRGQASRQETEALLEEGIAVLALPVLPGREH